MRKAFSWYAVRVKHDNGEITIFTVATSEENAKHLVMIAERCPKRSILSVERRPPADSLQPEVDAQVRALGYCITMADDTEAFGDEQLYRITKLDDSEEYGLFDTKTQAAEYIIKEKS